MSMPVLRRDCGARREKNPVMRTRPLSLLAALTLAITCAGPARACPLRVAFAALQATGSAHASRAYIAYLDGNVRDREGVAFTLDVDSRPVTVRAAPR